MQRAAGQDTILYRARALLVLALYDVCWLRNARVPAVAAFLSLPPADQLHFVPGEATMIKALCNGHAACGYSLTGQKEDIVFQVRCGLMRRGGWMLQLSSLSCRCLSSPRRA